MPRKPLDALDGGYARGIPGDGVFHPRGLPHGECGVRGRAPRSGGSVRRRVGSEDAQDDFLLCVLVVGAAVRKEGPSMRKIMQ
jgi:hypothetical protein